MVERPWLPKDRVEYPKNFLLFLVFAKRLASLNRAFLFDDAAPDLSPNTSFDEAANDGHAAFAVTTNAVKLVKIGEYDRP
jgi:hypothetical protein